MPFDTLFGFLLKGSRTEDVSTKVVPSQHQARVASKQISLRSWMLQQPGNSTLELPVSCFCVLFFFKTSPVDLKRNLSLYAIYIYISCTICVKL